MDYTIGLSTADRRRSLAFYRDGLGLEAFGPLADDGVPEPLQVRLAPSVSLMLIPTGGFGWVAGEDRVAPPGANECVLTVYAPDEDAVRARYETALGAGGRVCTSRRSGSGAPSQPRSPIPTATSG
jgi:catechol 2,3-dioxygenase-like lactoylglutathione lyase family enzyme